MNAKTPKQPSKTNRYWHAHVAAQKRSGLSRAEYARQHDLSYHALTYWAHKINTPQNQLPLLVPVSAKMQVRASTAENAALKICLHNGIDVEVGDSFSSTTLHRLLTILEER